MFNGVLGLFVIGAVLDFRYAAYTNLQFHQQVARLNAAKPGTTVTIPLNPPGWWMELTAHH